MSQRRERLATAQLYLICDAVGDDLLRAALSGGVDIVQLRMKQAADEEIVSAALRFRGICDAHGALLILNDRPELVDRCSVDGVHVGQDDAPVAEARELVGPARLLGLSTHSPQQIDDAGPEIDYIGVGPVFETPTKPGRPAVGVELIRYAARHARLPFFAIGGINEHNAGEVRAAGAERLAVVRALTQAGDPQTVARKLRAEAPVGSA